MEGTNIFYTYSVASMLQAGEGEGCVTMGMPYTPLNARPAQNRTVIASRLVRIDSRRTISFVPDSLSAEKVAVPFAQSFTRLGSIWSYLNFENRTTIINRIYNEFLNRRGYFGAPFFGNKNNRTMESGTGHF